MSLSTCGGVLRPSDVVRECGCRVRTSACCGFPAGFAHGFLVLSEKAHVLYKATDFYAPEHERTLAWNDPQVKIEWPNWKGEPIVSAKDQRGVALAATLKLSNRFPCESHSLVHPDYWVRRSCASGAKMPSRAVSSRDADIRDAQRVSSCTEHSSGVDRIVRSVHRCGWMREQCGAGFCCESRWRRQCGACGKEVGARLMFLSSDYVFDGKKTTPYETSDSRNPQSVYGRTKAEAEITTAGTDAGMLHRPNIVAVRSRREMFSRHNLKAGGKPSSAGRGQ